MLPPPLCTDQRGIEGSRLMAPATESQSDLESEGEDSGGNGNDNAHEEAEVSTVGASGVRIQAPTVPMAASEYFYQGHIF
jgi:hypothetical protein